MRLSLFGSVAHGKEGHDVDLMAEFDSTKHLSLLDMAGLERRLSALLEAPVDLAPVKMLIASATAQMFLSRPTMARHTWHGQLVAPSV